MKYLFTLLFFSLLSWSGAQQNSSQPYAQVEVSSFNVIEGEVFALSVNIHNDKAKSPPLISTHPSLSIVASSHQFQQKNRQLIDSYIYQVTIKKSGIIELPAIEVYTQKGGLIKTAPLKFTAQDFNQVGWDTLTIDQQTLAYGTLLNASNTTPYVGQMASAHLKVLLPANINIEEFRELDLKFNNIAADPFSLQNAPFNSVNTIRVDGAKYQIYNFNTQFSCLNPQEASIGNGDLILAVRAVNRSMGIFQTYTTIDLNFSLPKITLQAQNLPTGKPADFSGVIGNFTLSSSANLENYTNYSDVINVTFNLQGEGNFSDSIIPTITNTDNWQVYPTQIVNAIAQNNYHDITFHQIIRSNQPQKQIPSYKFNYFNPKTGQYEIAQSKPIELPSLVIDSAKALAEINTQKLTKPLGLLIQPLGWKQVVIADLSNNIKLTLSLSLIILTLYLIMLIIVTLRRRQQAKLYHQLKHQLLQTLNQSLTRQSFYKNLLHHLDDYLQKNNIQQLPNTLALEHEQWLAYAYDKDNHTSLDHHEANKAIKLTLKAIQKTSSKPKSLKSSNSLSLVITLSLVIMSSLNSWSQAATETHHWNQAFELYEQDNAIEAVKLYQSLINEQSEDDANLSSLADLYFNLGVCYEKLQRLDLAHLSYRYALKLQPSHPTSLHNLAILTDKQDFAQPIMTANWLAVVDTYKLWILSLALITALICCLHLISIKKSTHKSIALSVFFISCVILLGSLILYVYNYFYKEGINADSHSSLAIIISATSADYFESASSQSTRLGSLASGTSVYVKVRRAPYSLIQSISDQENQPSNLGWLNNKLFCLVSQAPQVLLKPFSIYPSNSPPTNLDTPQS